MKEEIRIAAAKPDSQIPDNQASMKFPRLRPHCLEIQNHFQEAHQRIQELKNLMTTLQDLLQDQDNYKEKQRSVFRSLEGPHGLIPLRICAFRVMQERAHDQSKRSKSKKGETTCEIRKADYSSKVQLPRLKTLGSYPLCYKDEESQKSALRSNEDWQVSRSQIIISHRVFFPNARQQYRSQGVSKVSSWAQDQTEGQSQITVSKDSDFRSHKLVIQSHVSTSGAQSSKRS